MAYNKNNRYKTIARIVAVYNQHKEQDVPDTFIVSNIFPKHGIYISYRSWMNYKSEPTSAYRHILNQTTLFANH